MDSLFDDLKNFIRAIYRDTPAVRQKDLKGKKSVENARAAESIRFKHRPLNSFSGC